MLRQIIDEAHDLVNTLVVSENQRVSYKHNAFRQTCGIYYGKEKSVQNKPPVEKANLRYDYGGKSTSAS